MKESYYDLKCLAQDLKRKNTYHVKRKRNKEKHQKASHKKPERKKGCQSRKAGSESRPGQI
jgi:hypothetical protein